MHSSMRTGCKVKMGDFEFWPCLTCFANHSVNQLQMVNCIQNNALLCSNMSILGSTVALEACSS